jgi:hypothetical protein
MRAAYKTRREPSRSGRRSWGYSGRLAGQRNVPSDCRVKAEPGGTFFLSFASFPHLWFSYAISLASRGWNKRNADAFAMLFAENGEVIGFDGSQIPGFAFPVLQRAIRIYL